MVSVLVTHTTSPIDLNDRLSAARETAAQVWLFELIDCYHSHHNLIVQPRPFFRWSTLRRFSILSLDFSLSMLPDTSVTVINKLLSFVVNIFLKQIFLHFYLFLCFMSNFLSLLKIFPTVGKKNIIWKFYLLLYLLYTIFFNMQCHFRKEIYLISL